jgi:putative transposase
MDFWKVETFNLTLSHLWESAPAVGECSCTRFYASRPGEGSQFTSEAFTSRLKAAEVRISWDGRGRVWDNIFIERLWRSVKYEEVYLKDYANVSEAISGIDSYFRFYNSQRHHQALGYRTSEQVFFGS